ncbi:MAG: hypothetical protein MUO63_14330, partial [Desulfobulbaceae bacterium]|nr:hypothetical protein [Desulfobulbaceae bacterium]
LSFLEGGLQRSFQSEQRKVSPGRKTYDGKRKQANPKNAHSSCGPIGLGVSGTFGKKFYLFIFLGNFTHDVSSKTYGLLGTKIKKILGREIRGHARGKLSNLLLRMRLPPLMGKDKQDQQEY